MLVSNIYSVMGNVVIQLNVIKIIEIIVFYYVLIRVLLVKFKLFWIFKIDGI